MPRDILRGGNGTTDAIVTMLGRLGQWEVPHLENIVNIHFFGCRTLHRPSLPSMVIMASVVKF